MRMRARVIVVRYRAASRHRDPTISFLGQTIDAETDENARFGRPFKR